MAGRPEGPSSPELEQGWQDWRGRTIQGSQPRCPPPMDSATARCPPFAQSLLGVPPTASAWCVLQAPDPAAYPCTRTPVHTCALTPTSRHTCAPGSAAVYSLLKPGPSSSIPLPSNSLPPKCQVALRNLATFSAFPFWVFREDKEENTSVNLMFLGCLIKRDEIAEQLRAGLAGAGSHALPLQAAASG